jgi:hypothetical protein
MLLVLRATTRFGRKGLAWNENLLKNILEISSHQNFSNMGQRKYSTFFPKNCALAAAKSYNGGTPEVKHQRRQLPLCFRLRHQKLCTGTNVIEVFFVNNMKPEGLSLTTMFRLVEYLARVYKSRSLLVKNKSTLISKITLSSN